MGGVFFLGGVSTESDVYTWLIADNACQAEASRPGEDLCPCGQGLQVPGGHALCTQVTSSECFVQGNQQGALCTQVTSSERFVQGNQQGALCTQVTSSERFVQGALCTQVTSSERFVQGNQQGALCAQVTSRGHFVHR